MKLTMRQTTPAAEVILHLSLHMTLHEAELLHNVIPAGANAPALALRSALRDLVNAVRKDYDSEVEL